MFAKRRFTGKFTDNFAIDENTGSFKYRADACCHRFDKRDTLAELNERVITFGNSAFSNEMRNIERVKTIIKVVGRKLQPNETLDSFIKKHILKLYV